MYRAELPICADVQTNHIKDHCRQRTAFVAEFATPQTPTIISVMSCQSAWNNSAPTGRIFVKYPIHKTLMLIPYDQLSIQTFQHNGNLITEQDTGEQNPLFQLAMDTMLTPETT